MSKSIALFQNTQFNLHKYLPAITKKNQKVLIIGNTIGFFGYTPIRSNSGYDLERFKWLINAARLGTHFAIIGEGCESCENYKEEEEGYYEDLFNEIYKIFHIKVKHKFYDSRIIIKKYDKRGEPIYDYTNYFKNIEQLTKNMKGKKFDITIENPPYSNGLHEKFLINILKISNKVVSVQPLSWLLGKRQNKKITEIIDNTKTDIEQINGNEFFDAAIGGTMGIISVDLTSDTSDIVFDGKAYSKCEEITTYSNDELLVEFKNIVEPLYTKDNLDKHIHATNNVYHKQYIVEEPKDNPYIVIMQRYSGHSTIRSKEIGEFYAIYSKDRKFEEMSGYYNDLKNKQSKSGTDFLRFYVNLKTKNIAERYWNYTHSLFFTTALYLSKTTLDLISGSPLSKVPWFDFSDPVFSKSPSEIDDYLFKKYNISNEIRNHIEEILPDYYGIRKSQN